MKFFRLIAFLGLSALHSQAFAAQTLYKQTDDGWFVYREDKSCAAYIDFETGTTLRLSNRADESRMYVNLYNSEWEYLRGITDQTVMLSLKFVDLKRSYTTPATVVANDFDYMGFAGGHLTNQEILMRISSSPRLEIGILFSNSTKQVTIEKMNLAGGDKAALYLTECTDEFF